ncbi:MAG TPA: aminotransferase class IV [SAR202 cluster bacterium]|jgi:branched-chain amino acid aminotransferase|nr:aminotransferase class IV [SAR202 cluster bacterium]|tara:strand:+ start:260 stop:1177 length:918 start_codon:yes stop_codon:yes gene_type:complete
MMDYMIWVNGDFVRRSEATISMLDRGFRLGDVVFDTSRTFDGKVFRLREHLVRLYRSLQYTRIDPGMSIDEMERVTLDVVEHNEETRSAARDDYMITQIVTRGAGGVVGDIEPHVSIMIDPIDYVRYAPLYDTGAHVVIPRTRSFSPDQIDPKVKHYSRLSFVMADLEARDVDPNAFPVLLDTDGNVSESIGANFCIVSNGVLRTSGDRSILQGVSRMTLMELAEQLNIPTSEEDLQPYDVYTADEAFLCSTPFSLLPVGKADNRQIGDSVPGPITKQLLAAWSERVGFDIVDQFEQRARALNAG